MSILTKLLNFLPTCFNIKPEQVSVFTLAYDDSKGKLEYTVEDNVFSCKTFSSFTNDLEIDLEGLTISDLVEKINTRYNYSATLHSMGSASAMRLAEINGSTGSRVYAFTSNTWAIFKTLALELKDVKKMITETLKQMSIQGSTDYITDYWCEFLNSFRKADETDISFAVRTVNNIGSPRSNNVALEIILEEYYGYSIDVIDLIFEQTSIMYMNDTNTPMHNQNYPIANSDSIEKEPGTFALIFPDNTISNWETEDIDELRALIYAVKAAGTRCKVLWSDLPDDPWMYMNDTDTPFHDSDFILPYTKSSEYFSIYL